MGNRGRKPLALGHLRNLNGSQSAKRRMSTLLSTLQEDCTVCEACEKLNLSESRLHELRHNWLQASLEALEPRVPGRRPHIPTEAEQRVRELEQENEALQRDLALSRARCEVLEVTGRIAPAPKKGSRRS